MKKISNPCLIKRLLKNAIVMKIVTHPIIPKKKVENTRPFQNGYK